MASFVDSHDLVGRAIAWQGRSISELNDLCFDIAHLAGDKVERDAVSAALAVLLANSHLPTLHRCQGDLFCVALKDTDDEAFAHLVKAETTMSRLDAASREHGTYDSRIPKMKRQINYYRAYFAQPADVRAQAAQPADVRTQAAQPADVQAQASQATAADAATADPIIRSRALPDRPQSMMSTAFLDTTSREPSTELVRNMLGPDNSLSATATTTTTQTMSRPKSAPLPQTTSLAERLAMADPESRNLGAAQGASVQRAGVTARKRIAPGQGTFSDEVIGQISGTSAGQAQSMLTTRVPDISAKFSEMISNRGASGVGAQQRADEITRHGAGEGLGDGTGSATASIKSMGSTTGDASKALARKKSQKFGTTSMPKELRRKKSNQNFLARAVRKVSESKTVRKVSESLGRGIGGSSGGSGGGA